MKKKEQEQLLEWLKEMFNKAEQQERDNLYQFGKANAYNNVILKIRELTKKPIKK